MVPRALQNYVATPHSVVSTVATLLGTVSLIPICLVS